MVRQSQPQSNALRDFLNRTHFDGRSRFVDWFEITEEIAVTWPDPIAVYAASKAIAEKALWAFAKEHLELNIVTRLFNFRLLLVV